MFVGGFLLLNWLVGALLHVGLWISGIHRCRIVVSAYWAIMVQCSVYIFLIIAEQRSGVRLALTWRVSGDPGKVRKWYFC